MLIPSKPEAFKACFLKRGLHNDISEPVYTQADLGGLWILKHAMELRHFLRRTLSTMDIFYSTPPPSSPKNSSNLFRRKWSYSA